MSADWQCENCQMFFENQQTYNRHKDKFCTNSKYANLDSLTQEFGSLMQGKDISLYGRPQLAQKGLKYNFNTSKIQEDSKIDREYRSLLKQIGDRQDLKKKLQRQRLAAQQELMSLQKKQKEVVVEAKRQDLQQILDRREALAREQQQLQKQIRLFQKQRKEQSRVKTLQPDQDFVYREGREAGKIAMQRRLLEEKKRDIEANLKVKKRQEERLNKQLNNMVEQPIFVPQYRKNQSIAVSKLTANQYQKNNVVPAPISPPTPVPPCAIAKQSRNNRQINQVRPSYLNESASKSKVSVADSLQNQAFLRASRFAGNEKTLFQNLNPKGKSDQDIFIESLTAQEYDALNLLARLPKDSQLYQVKLKQYRQMSQVRQQLKDKIHKIRLQKVKKEFQYEKSLTETQKNNLMWLDKNRKQMLNKEANAIQNYNNKEIQKSQNYQNYPNNPSLQPVPCSNQQLPLSSQRLPSIGNIPMRPINTREGVKGYKIAVKYVKGYQNKGPMCVKLVVQQQSDNGAQWAFMTKYHDQYAPKDDRNPFNPRAKNRLDQLGNVVFNQTFEIRQDLQALYNTRQSQIYMWVLLMEKQEQKISNEPEVYVWYCFKLTHFGQLKEGVFTFNLYHDRLTYPTATDMNKMKGRAKQQIVVELADTIFTVPAPQPNRNQSDIPENTNMSKGNTTKKNTSKRGKSIKIKSSQNNTQALQNIHEQFFMQNQESSDFQVVNKGEPLNFDFSIVGMRTLPSYTGPLKLEILFLDQGGASVMNRSQVLAQSSADMYNPKINFSKKVRNQQMLASTVVQIRILALSTLNYQPGLLGFSYFHLFFNAQGQPQENDEPAKYFLINGYYQIPIYWGNPSGYLSIQKLRELYPKIPCSSMLISVGLPAEQISKFPDYSSQKYNTAFFEVDVIEYRLFQEQSKREVLDSRDYVKGYLKFKGLSSKGLQEQTKLLNQVLSFNSQNISNLMMLRSMAEYNSSFGVVVSVDMVSVAPSKDSYYYFCTVCICPPATYYKQSEVDLEFIYQIDLSSSFTQDIVFKGQPLTFNPTYSPNTSLIIELNRIRISSSGKPDSSIEPCGSTVLPVFDLNQQIPCVNVGIHQINLNDGQFDPKTLKALQTQLINYVDQKIGSKKIQEKVTVRIMNGFFPRQLKALKPKNKGQTLRKVFESSAGFSVASAGVKKMIQDAYGVTLQQ